FQVFRAVVDDLVGAVLAADRELLGARRGGDDPRAHALSDLHRREPYAARRSEHEQRLTLSKLRAIAERVERRTVRSGEARRGDEVDAAWHGYDLRRVGDELLGHAARRADRDDVVADLHAGHARAQRLDDAGHFAARWERARRLELVFPPNGQAFGEI